MGCLSLYEPSAVQSKRLLRFAIPNFSPPTTMFTEPADQSAVPCEIQSPSLAVTTSPSAAAKQTQENPLAGEKRGRVLEIYVALGAIAIPLFIFSTSLIALVFIRRVRNNQTPSSSLSFGIEEDEPGVYYVRVSSTTLVLLASLSSSIAPTLVGFFMTLFSYFASQRMLKLSEDVQYQNLPTPYQLVLLIKILDGGISALWQWIKYTFRWRTVSIVNTSARSLVLVYFLVYTCFFILIY